MRTLLPALVCGAALLTGLGLRGAAPALAHTAESPRALARAVLDAYAARDQQALARLALSETEFKTIVYPELPASRPERNLSAGYLWSDLAAKSRASLSTTFPRFESTRPLQLVGLEFDGPATQYGSYTVFRKARLIVRDPGGAETSLRLFGSIIEAKGRYKVFSYVID